MSLTDIAIKNLSDFAVKGLAKGLFHLEVEGLEKLDFNEPCIIAPNHVSLADPALLMTILPDNCWFVANTDIAEKFKVFMKGRNVFPVDPMNPYAVRDMVHAVGVERKPLAIFPEGRITVTGGLMKIYEGTGFIGMKTGANIYPVTIDGLERSYFSYLKGKVKRSLTPKVKIIIGDPFKIEKREGVSMKIQKREAAERILKELQKGRFDVKHKQNVNLFNELLDAAKTYGRKMVISEDTKGAAKYKDLILKTYGLSEKYSKLLGDEKNVGVLMPNSNAHVAMLFSLFKLGKTPVVLNFSFGKQTIAENCETAGLKTVLSSKTFIEQGKLHHLVEAFQDKGVRVIYLDEINPSFFSESFVSTLTKQSDVSILMQNSVLRLQTTYLLKEKNVSFSFLDHLKDMKVWEEKLSSDEIKFVLTTQKMIEDESMEQVFKLLEEKKVTVHVFDDKKDLKKPNVKKSIEEKQKERKEKKPKLEVVFTEATFSNETKEVYHTISASEKGAAYLKYKSGERARSTDNELVLFTSGSESTPKGVVLTHDNIRSNIYQARSIIDFTSADKIFNALPMFHSFGLTAGTFLPFLLGVPVYLFPSPIQYKNIRELSYVKNATMIFGTSTFLAGYAKDADRNDFQRIRYAFAGAEKMRPEVSNDWFEKFGVKIFEGYGITETAPILALNTPQAYKRGSVGQFLPGIEYKLEAVEGIDKGGKLFVKGPNVMKGYLIHGEGFKKHEGWYDTGDVVAVDENGFIEIQSRVKRFAKIGGEMISLNLVEQLANECFQFDGFGSVNIPDERKGEKIVLFTTLKDFPKEKFREFIIQNGHSSLHIPANIKYIEKLPVLGSGKADYVSLKKIAENLK